MSWGRARIGTGEWSSSGRDGWAQKTAEESTGGMDRRAGGTGRTEHNGVPRTKKDAGGDGLNEARTAATGTGRAVRRRALSVSRFVTPHGRDASLSCTLPHVTAAARQAAENFPVCAPHQLSSGRAQLRSAGRAEAAADRITAGPVRRPVTRAPSWASLLAAAPPGPAPPTGQPAGLARHWAAAGDVMTRLVGWGEGGGGARPSRCRPVASSDSVRNSGLAACVDV